MENKNDETKASKSFSDYMSGFGKACRSNLKPIILSAVMAVIVWIAVSVQVFPTIESSISGILIQAQPTEYMVNNNLQIVGNYTGTTDIRIEGKRFDISALKSDDFYAELDLSSVRSAGTFTVPVSVSSKTGVEYNLLETSQLAVTLTIDEIITMEFPVKAYAPDISLPEGYYVDEITSSPEKVSLTGSAAVLNKISRVEARAEYDGEMRESHEVRAPLAIYTDNGSKLPNEEIRLSTESVLVNIPVYMQKELALTFSFAGVPLNFDISSIAYDIQPPSIMVAAPDESILNLSELNIGTINIADIRLNQTTATIPITLPEGYKNLSGNNSARIVWDIADYGKLDFAVTNFAAVNVPDNMEATIITNELNVSVIGPSEQLSGLTSGDFYATANLLGMSLHEGTQDIPVTVMISGAGSSKCWVQGSYKITVTARTVENTE